MWVLKIPWKRLQEKCFAVVSCPGLLKLQSCTVCVCGCHLELSKSGHISVLSEVIHVHVYNLETVNLHKRTKLIH